MEQKVNPWKANLTNGLILGLIGVVYSLIFYFLDLSLNKTQGYAFILIQVVILFLLLKSYRDNLMHGQITYGESVGAGVIICLYYSIIVSVFVYILYAVIDPGLIGKQLALAEEEMGKRGLPQEAMDAGMAWTTKIMKPGVMAFTGIFFNMIMGTVISLIVSIFIKKEGNPLLDIQPNQPE
jgi:hypothetical protein